LIPGENSDDRIHNIASLEHDITEHGRTVHSEAYVTARGVPGQVDGAVTP
jgi:hypothetical protein